jgi:GABA permease
MRSYLVVGNQTLDSPELEAAIADRGATGPVSFHIVVPATPIQRGLTWDEDEARKAAQARLDDALERFRSAGASVTGEIGHRDPVEATEDALRGREVDEVLLSTLPPGMSRWLGQDVPSRLKGSVAVPVTVVTTQRQSVSARS